MNKEQGGIRINKYLSEYGVCSRREGDRLIEAGQVIIAGRPARMGDRVLPGEEVRVKGRPVGERDREVLLLFYKPRGVVCTSQRRERNNIIDYLDYPIRVYPVGRLDQDSEGLILLTNQGELANWMTHPGYGHEKEYQVRVDRPVTKDFLNKMSRGIPLEGKTTNPCRVQMRGEREFSIVLTQGMNRQIRRMCEYLGYRVLRLKRVRVLDFTLGDLKAGQYREATKKEWAALKAGMGKSAQKGAEARGGRHGVGAGRNAGTGTKAK